MLLAKDKNGRIGRKIPNKGFNAQIEIPPEASHLGDVYLNTNRLEHDERYWKNEEALQIAKAKAREEQEKLKRKALELRSLERNHAIKDQQRKPLSRDQRLLGNYFRRQMGLTEQEKVARSLVTADFSQSGADPQIIPVPDEYKGVWAADYRWEKVIGNPLSRDGVFGPGVTDYDRIVKGSDIHQWNEPTVVGGTQLGVYNDEVKFAKNNQLSGFGSLFDDLSDWASSVYEGALEIADETLSEIRAQLPEELKKLTNTELKKLLASQGQPGVPTISIPRYTTVPAAAQNQNWVMYAGLGLLGLGVLFIGIKALK